VDATYLDPNAHGTDDLLVSDETGVRLVYGRADWPGSP
jgi:hypothetical protein